MHTCSPQVAVSTMQAIVRTESGGNPWAVNDNTAKLKEQPLSREEAVSWATYLIAQGHSVDMGLGQIDSRTLAKLGLSVEQVFEPCTNLSAAAAILTAGYRRAVTTYGKGQQALLAAISTYNTGNMSNGFYNGYVQKVVANARAKAKSDANWQSRKPHPSYVVQVEANGQTYSYRPIS
jgi:type IV secretion system protein VirB1